MPKCSRCPIKRECSTLGMMTIDKKTGLKKLVCPLIAAVQVALNIIAERSKTSGKGEIEVSEKAVGG